jgi:di/tricarboxylate transporter
MQIIAVALILGLGFAAFAHGRVRHDLIALLMLLASVAVGVVTPAQAFTGLGDPVVVTVAGVMVISAAIARSGVLKLALRPFSRLLSIETGIAATFSVLCAVASAFMNNIGALALLLPAALNACKTASVSPSRVLMPMAFSSLLGGLVTLIGTPPNVIIARIRSDYSGTPFTMFDFAPVGAILAVAGVALVLVTVRWLPRRLPAGGEPLLFKIADYLFEVKVLERKRASNFTVGDLRTSDTDEETLSVHAIDRGGIVFAAPSAWRPLVTGDVLQLEGRAPVIQTACEKFGLQVVGGVEDDALEAAVMECVVSERSLLASAVDPSSHLARAGVALLAVSRNGRAVVERLNRFKILPGDVILLQAPDGAKADIIERYALLPLAERSLEFAARKSDWRPAAVLAIAIVVAALGVASLSVSLVGAVAVLALLGLADQKSYNDIDWSIVVLLAALIPVAEAFSNVGAGAIVADWLSTIGSGAPPYVVIGAALAATMLVTPFLNNAAAVLIMAPIAAGVGLDSGVKVDAMLMAVAIGASCDFLTPIGHQSNTLVMGPGGYQFFDYARLGAPLSALVLIAGTMLITLFWA